MLVGHAAVAFAAKRIVPTVSLGWLMLAALAPDVIRAALVALDVETAAVTPSGVANGCLLYSIQFVHQQFSHSLATILALGCVLGTAYFAVRRFARGATITLAVVASHWVLDWVWYRTVVLVPTAPGTRLGLGLGDLLGAPVVEIALLALGLVLYTRTNPARDRFGLWGMWGLVLALIAVEALERLSPVPTGVATAIAVGVGCAGFAIWAAWIDRHRWAIIDTQLERRTFS